ncbi:MAG: hypothetical protein ACRD2H_13080 [Terriglobales bacterium]
MRDEAVGLHDESGALVCGLSIGAGAGDQHDGAARAAHDRRDAQRGGTMPAGRLAGEDLRGTLHLPYDEALEIAKRFCATEPQAVLIKVRSANVSTFVKPGPLGKNTWLI